jgi:hypothetical protein
MRTEWTELRALESGFARNRRMARMALRDRIERQLRHISVPTLVARSSRDVLVPQAWAERVATLLPDGHLLIMPGLAHTITYTAPRSVRRGDTTSTPTSLTTSFDGPGDRRAWCWSGIRNWSFITCTIPCRTG